MKLYIGNKNYSTWSLRPWILLAKSDISFDEIKLPLDTPQFYTALESVTPTRKVPCLTDGELTVWDSLAICEYINDTYLSGQAWPEDPQEKAKARSLAAEMHSGFSALRSEAPMNIRAARMVTLSDAAQQDLKRIEAIFTEQMMQFADHGGWLFGQYSIADAMFAPVVMRLRTYQIRLGEMAQKYVDHVLSCPVLQQWIDAALQETEIVAADEAGEPCQE
ncbi:glutathione S-transferase family protein [Vibrio mangrovi]|uniref:Glutathione S-transferase YfcF n=1 Tax=Vibrio mangrovi TaxID=474394 RepID=A0A1Y6ITW5_9VIBR|nr:glutathione S-transferase family protein [Vibrio mangrovi]MDW6004827.1 glutathione S-transferase family protein [Vibrio mangrovi]SMS01119.1 Glutathione S-transferase YfcF [Vibrio mangrovi]